MAMDERDLAKARKELQETSDRLSKDLAHAREIAALTARNAEKAEAINKQILAAAKSRVPDAGTIQRLGSVFAPFNMMPSLYARNEAYAQGKTNPSQLADAFFKAYITQVKNNMKTVVTGKNYALGQKTAKDILVNQRGYEDNIWTTLAGLGFDVALDATNWGGGKALGQGVAKLSKFGIGVAKKIPQINKTIDSLGGAFNIFHQIEKNLPVTDVEKFKNAFRVAVESKNFSKLADLGIDVTKYAGKKAQTAKVGGSLNIPEIHSILGEAFLPGKESLIGKVLDSTSGFYKRVLSWSPKFQFRNFMGALTQGVSEGSGISDYWNAAKLMYGKETGSMGALYKQLKESGVLSQTGMFEQTLGKFPGKVAAFGESLHRSALALSDLANGKTVEEAITHTEQVFYRYAPQYKTAVEKQIAKLFPFYSFQRGQFAYWPEALTRKGAFWNNMATVKRDTEPTTDSDKPSWWKDMFSVGNLGNLGFQLEDFLKNITGDAQNIWSQIQPVIKGISEGILNWNVFKGRAISTDKGADQYQYLGAFGKLVGYDPNSQTTNPYMKWIAETMVGPLLQPIKDFFDPNKSVMRSITSVRPYDLSEERVSWQKSQENIAQGSFWEHLANRLGLALGSSTATATQNPVPVMIAGVKTDAMKGWAKATGQSYGSYWTASQATDASETSRTKALNNREKLLEDISRVVSQTQDPVNNAYISYLNKFLAAGLEATKPGVGAEGARAKQEALTREYKTTSPYYIGSGGGISVSELQKIFTYGMNPYEIAFNKIQKNLQQITSKIVENFGTNQNSPQNIEKAYQIGLQAWEQNKGTLGINFNDESGKAIDKLMKESLMQKAADAMEKINQKILSATAETIGNMADAEMEGTARIEMQKQAALAKFAASENGRLLQRTGMEAEYLQAEYAIVAKYNRQLQEQAAKDAKAVAELMGNVVKDNMKNTIEALKSIYERGGLTISDYINKQKVVQFKALVEDMLLRLDATMKEISPAATSSATSSIISGNLPAIGATLGGKPSKYDGLILKYAIANDLDPNLVKAVVQQESNYNPNAISKKGAMGLMQLMPGTAKDLGVANAYDPEQNIKAGVSYLRQMVDKFGDLRLALGAYNAGPGRVMDALKNKTGLPKETLDYMNAVSARAGSFGKSAPKVIDGFVKKIEDADTIVITDASGKPIKIRFDLIDAPELSHLKGQAAQPYGEEAKNYLQSLLKVGDKVSVAVTGMDKYNRNLGIVQGASGKIVNTELLKAGYAVPSWDFIKDPATLTYMNKLLVEAIGAKLGQWRDEAAKIISPSAFRPYQRGEKTLPEGQTPAQWKELAELRLKDQTPQFDIPQQSTEIVKKQQEAMVELDKLVAKLREAGASGNYNLVDVLNQEISDLFKKMTEQGIAPPEHLAALFKTLQDGLNNFKGATIALTDEEYKLTEQLKKSQVELIKSSQKIIQEVTDIKNRTPMGLGFTENFVPYINGPAGKDVDSKVAAAQAALETQIINAAQSLSATLQNLKGGIGDLISQQGEGGFPTFEGTDPGGYSRKIQEILTKEIELTTGTTTEAEKRRSILASINSAIVADDQKTSAMRIELERLQGKVRQNIVLEMAGMIKQTADIIYQESEGSAKSMFYLSKAMAIADIMLRAPDTITAAYAAGVKFGGPYGLAVGTAYAGIASAFIGAQLGVALAQTFKGPGKAKGGPLIGGSGTKDDIPFMGMGGEWVIKSPTVKKYIQKYGSGFMEYFNEGLLDIPASIIDVASSSGYNYPSTTHFADGGPVPVNGAPLSIVVELKNESGTELKTTKQNSSFDGQQYVVQVWIDAYDRNIGGLHERLQK